MSPTEVKARRAEDIPNLEVRAHMSMLNMGNTPSRSLLNEDAFVSMLYLERRRAERARKRFVLILLDVKKALASTRMNVGDVIKKWISEIPYPLRHLCRPDKRIHNI